MSNMGAYERIAFLESRMAALEGRVASQLAVIDSLIKAAPDYTPETLEDGATHVIKDTARQVAAAHGLSFQQIMSKSHAWRIVHPRQRAWLLTYRGGIGKSEIARFFNVDHTTVTSGIRMAEKREKARGVV